MPPSRTKPTGLLLAIALSLGACTTAAPTGSAPGPSSSPTVAAASPSASPNPTPSSSAESSPPASPTAGEASPTPEPTPVEPEPSDEPMTGTAGPGCGTGQLGFFTHRDEIPDMLHFGGATIEFTTAYIGLRNGTYAADDVIPGGIGLSPKEIAVRVDPETHILLRGDGLVLTQLQAGVVRWETVEFDGGLGGSRASPDPLVWRLRNDGAISVSAPEAPGDYMVEFVLGWHGTCTVGDGVSYSRIKVNG